MEILTELKYYIGILVNNFSNVSLNIYIICMIALSFLILHKLRNRRILSTISVYFSAYKSASSRLIKHDFSRVKQFLWKEMFWFKSFCLLTTGGAPIDVIKKYIQNQGNNQK